MSRGSQVQMPGKKANTKSRVISVSRKGREPYTICLKFRPEMEMAVNRL